MKKSNIAYSVIGIIIVIAVVAIYYMSMTGSVVMNNTTISGFTGGNTVSLQLTDPPSVPAGTQYLMVNYNSLEVHVSGTSNSGWVQSNSSGSINLLSLLNVSQTIGTVVIPNNSVINQVRFNIASASIEINGTTYNLTVPSDQVTAHISSNAGLNNSPGVLLSLSPTVISILSVNSSVFVMVPSVRAVIIQNGTSNTTVKVGSRRVLNSNDTMSLDKIKSNITVSSTSLSISGNVVMLQMSVTNNGNQSISLKNIGLYGAFNSYVNKTAVDNHTQSIETELKDRLQSVSVCSNVTTKTSTNTTATTNTTMNTTTNIIANTNARSDMNGSMGLGNKVISNQDSSVGIGVNVSTTGTNTSISGNVSGNDKSKSSDNSNISGDFKEYHFNSTEVSDISERIHSQVGLNLNASICSNTGLTQFENQYANKYLELESNFGARQSSFRQVHFLVSSNGTLSLPYLIEDFNNTGYTLQAGQTRKFVFEGQIVTSDHGLVITPVVNNSYSVRISGEEVSKSVTNVTATSS